ncbi:hypothetical protein ACJX0J_012851, partial [Zea mays]
MCFSGFSLYYRKGFYKIYKDPASGIGRDIFSGAILSSIAFSNSSALSLEIFIKNTLIQNKEKDKAKDNGINVISALHKEKKYTIDVEPSKLQIGLKMTKEI